MASTELENGAASPQPELDIEKLHSLPSEQQDLYLLTYTSDLTRHVAALDADGATAHQLPVKREALKIAALSSPPATRVIRNNLGRCLSGIFAKGDRKVLIETINELLAVLVSGKTDRHHRAKHTAVHCLGTVFEAAGDSAILISANTCAIILRQLKSAHNDAGFRASIFTALGRIIRGIRRSADETVVRDIWKQARSVLSSDKALIVQASTCWCLEQIFVHTPYLDDSNNFERLQSAVWKALDSHSTAVRGAAAKCLAAVYVKNFSASPNPVVSPKKPKRTKQKNEGDDADSVPERSSSPAPQKQATSLAFGLLEILRQLSQQYHRNNTTNRMRAGIALCYLRIFTNLGEGVVENQYGLIARHFSEDLLSSPSIANNRYRLLITRKFVRIVLQDVIGRKMLGETAQINAVRFLVNNIIKDYPQAVKERPEPTKETLIAALDATTSLIQSLESATSVASETCRDGLFQVLLHPSYAVQVHAAKCLQALVLASPHQLLPSITICMNSVNRELGHLSGPRRSPRRCIGFAFGLAATLSISSQQPLHGSVDVYSRILTQATTILKSSSSSDLRVSSTQIQVAWILIGGLMSLGPNFVKMHLSQLLLLWRNALPKPLSNDNIGQRTLLELSFLAHVRECALGSIHAFLANNSRLLTVDVSKRLAAMLQNTMTFLNNLPAKKSTDDGDRLLSPALQLQDYDVMVRRRVFQCYTQLIDSSPQASQDSILQSNLLSTAASCFADPENLSPGSLSSTIASSTATFDNIWELGDNSAFGLNGIVNGLDISSAPTRRVSRQQHWLSLQGVEAEVERVIRSPICGETEHDATRLYAGIDQKEADPLGTGAVNAAIHVFAAALPFQSPKVQEGVLEQVSTLLAGSHAQQNPAKDMAVTVNVATAVLLALQTATRDIGLAAGNIKGSEAEKALQELLHVLVVHHDLTVRHLAARALGCLCKCSGNDLTAREVAFLIDLIVSNREPSARAGCAMALGYIHSELGGMSAGYHMKNILGVLMSLASDPHPTVHFWAIEGLSRVADSAGLSFSGYVSSTLGTIAQLYVVDTHNEETSSLPFSNLEFDLPTCTTIARCVDAMINVLGPDLEDMAKNRNMILTLTYQFQIEPYPLVSIESLRCLEHLSMYAPGHISFRPYVRQLQAKLSSDEPKVRETALTGLYNAMRRGAEAVLRSADEGLEEQIWLTLHDMYGKGLVRDLIDNWTNQSGVEMADIWITRIQKIFSKANPLKTQAVPRKSTQAPAEPDLQDEEVAGFNAAQKSEKDDSSSNTETGQELLRWQARCTVIECLNSILSKIAKEVQTHDEVPAVDVLQPRVADIVRIAFSASTAAVVEIRIRGIQIIGRVLQIFGRVPDPDFPEATLLEQYQAQISSALTPAFASDSSPTLAAEAVSVCASFISTGIVTKVDRMGRILRLLVTALDDFSKESEVTAIGDLKGLSSNAQVMVKLAVFSAWADLQIASRQQKYLEDVVRPHLRKLTPLWLTCLREYARLKFEPETSPSAALEGGLESIYGSLSREILLEFYQAAWLRFVHVIANLIDDDSGFVFEALDGKSESLGNNGQTDERLDINYRDEPVAFFFVLFGISFQALVSSVSNQSHLRQEKMLEILQAMTSILRPSVAGLAIYQDAIFSETVDLLNRLALTEGLEIQTVVLEITRSLCIEHPSARRSHQDAEGEENLSDDIDQLFELTRIIVSVLSRHIANLTADHIPRSPLSVESVPVVILALNALVDSAEVFPTIIKGDLHACIFHVFATTFSTGAAQEELVPQSLPIFRRFVTSLVANPQSESVTQLRSALARLMAIIKIAQRRESEAALQCEKNALLATSILLAPSAKILPASDTLLPRFLDEVLECLGNRLTTKVSAGLSRSLLLLSTAKSSGQGASPAESVIAAHLLPRLIEFLVNPSDVEGTEEARTIVASAITSFALSLPQTQRPAAIGLILPTLLKRADVEGEAVWKETSSRLLELASREEAAFRAALARMDTEQRSILEEVLRIGGAAAANDANKMQGNTAAEEEREPTIALKLDF